MADKRDHYETLGLSTRRGDAALTTIEIKQAYRQALLQHHPDKIGDLSAGEHSVARSRRPTSFSVDQITSAFKTLSDPVTKTKYDRTLRLQDRPDVAQKYYSGLDVVDLDDLEYDGTHGKWWRACRCGQEGGFIVTEQELEENAKSGEFITGCRGCSLWLKVLFSTEEEVQDAGQAQAEAPG